MNYVIIGNSAAGVSAAETIRDIDQSSPITIISDERDPFYSKSLIPDFISGKVSLEKTFLRSETFYKDMGITPLLGEKVERVYPKKNTVALSSGREIGYDKLLVSTGAVPKVLIDVEPGLNNFFTARTLEDAKAVKEACAKAKSATVIGAGLIGLKLAVALNSTGLDVIVLGKYEILLPRVMDSIAGEILREVFEENGITVLTQVKVSHVSGDGVHLSDGQFLPSDFVVMAAGVRPNADIFDGTEVEVGEGIITDPQMRTSVDNIYAAGDVVEDVDLLRKGNRFINPIWPKAVLQGRIAGSNMAGVKRDFPGSMMMNSVQFFDTPLISAGIVLYENGDYQEQVIKYNKEGKVYKKLIYEKDRLKGAILLGDIDRAGVITNLIKEQKDISSIREELSSPGFGYEDILNIPEADRDWIV